MTDAAQPQPASPGAARSLTELTQPERLLVWSLRATALGHADCPALTRTFDRLGAAAVLQAQFVLVKLLGLGARRVLRLHPPGCACAGLDETAVVGLAAAAQAVAGNGDGLLRLRIGFLARPEYAESIRRAALALADALDEAGLRLPLRLDQDAQPTAPGELRVVH